MIRHIKLAKVQRDMLLQPRAELYRDWIKDYAQDMLNGAEFPPVVVFYDGDAYWLADGFHRLYACEAAGFDIIAADVRNGKRRDALHFALSANADHGHRRTNEDKRRAVDIMLDDPEWSKLTDEEIARVCLVSDRSVANRRRDKLPKNVSEPDEAKVSLEPPAEQPEQAGEEWIEAELEPAAPEPSAERFDWSKAELRAKAMDAIRALASLPSAQTVLDAWMDSWSYGEPVATLDDAVAWLGAFTELYRAAEPLRWARVQAARTGGEMQHAAE